MQSKMSLSEQDLIHLRKWAVDMARASLPIEYYAPDTVPSIVRLAQCFEDYVLAEASGPDPV